MLASVPDPYYELGREPLSLLEKVIPLKESLLSSASNTTMDAAAFMGRSFRVGWGPCLTLVHAGAPLGLPSDSAAMSEAEDEDEERTPSPPNQFYLFAQDDKDEKSSRTLITAKPTNAER